MNHQIYSTDSSRRVTGVVIVRATVLLHNFLRSRGDMIGLTVDEEIGETFIPGSWRSEIGLLDIPRVGSNNYSFSSKSTREAIMYFFTSDQGSLPWQEDYFTRGL